MTNQNIMKTFKWEIKYNNQSIGKCYFTKQECKRQIRILFALGLFGYTINKI